MRNLSQLVCSAGFLALAACSSYNPDLPAEPFLCGTEDPKCPDGYECKDGGGGRMVCVKPMAEVIDSGIDASPCDDDHNLEPNNDTGHAYQTMIDTGTMSIPYSGLSICPMGDVDVYSVQLTKGPTTGTENLEVTVMYNSGGAVLQVAILGAGGQTLANGSPMGANTIHAYIPNLPHGQYYVKVFGPASGESTINNYKMTITTSL